MNDDLPLNVRVDSQIIEYLNTKDFTANADSSVPLDTPLFEPIPSVVMFSNYEALKVRTQVFKLRNRDNVTRRVKIIQPDTNLFKIVPFSEDTTEENFERQQKFGSKVAPGLEVSYVIKFAPETKTDYKYFLTVVTEREKFLVPIVAVGKKAMLDFPDEINFGNNCPVKYTSEKPVIIHNKGEKPTKWEIHMTGAFSCNKIEGVLEESASEQIVFRFNPLQRKTFVAKGYLLYDGEEAEFTLKGAGVNGEVSLCRNILKMEETYISLENRASIKIFNKSTVKIDFEWRAFKTEAEELEKKRLVLTQIDREEEEKKSLILETLDLADVGNFQDSANEGEDLQGDTESGSSASRRRKALLLLQRKYAAIRKAVEEDQMLFEHDNFSIKPISGSIWPNSELTINISFKPKSATKYNTNAYCNVSCCDDRLPLFLEGEGLGPKAFLSTNNLSVGDIFVNDKQTFNIYIENKGEIPAKFSLIKTPSSSSSVVTFDVEESELAVGQRLGIIMTFQSCRIGEFQEQFKWRLHGAAEFLVLLVRGHIRAPRFEFDRKVIDFKKVSFRFEESQEIKLTNTSTVPFAYELRIPQDGQGDLREFEIEPKSNTILPNSVQNILVKFIPQRRKVYSLAMVLDIKDIGKDMKSIPIIAESKVPKVRIQPEELNFGKIFLRFQQTKEIELINESKLFARFIVHPINPKFSSFGKVITSLDKGQILPESKMKLNVTLITSCINTFQIDLIIEIVSDDNTQHLVKIRGESIGPTVELSRKEIDFGDVEVLEKRSEKVTITNKSDIEADFFAFMKSKNSIFTPVQKHYLLKPQQSFDVDVVCIADDRQKFTDTLFFVIKEGVDKEVQLRARGVGHTIFCENLKQINFGILYTHRSEMKEIFLENKGRRPQTLKWIRKKEPRELEDVKKDVDPDRQVFSIHPETVVLPPKTGLMFQIRAYSTDSGKIAETFSLTSAIGAERKSEVFSTSIIDGEFIKPTVLFSKKAVCFKYVWMKDEVAAPMSQELEVECAGPLPVNFGVMVDWPFTVSPDSMALLPKKKGMLKIDFDPSQKKDRISGHFAEKLYVKHNRHPKNDTIDVTAEFCFPNLTLEPEEVDFGTVMNDTSKKLFLNLKNTGQIAASYTWHFLDTGSPDDAKLNEVFDILPMRGVVEKDEVEKIEFSYYAQPFKSHKITALCRVEGGPDYLVKVRAEASDVAYSLSLEKQKNTIDIGEVSLKEKVTREFFLENKSKVLFEYSIKLDAKQPRAKYMKEFITISPTKGRIEGGGKTSIKVSVIPGFPGQLKQFFILQVAHFEPETILLQGHAVFPTLRFDRPLTQDARAFRALRTMAEKALDREIDDSIQAGKVLHPDVAEKVLHALEEGQTEELEEVINELSDAQLPELEKVLIQEFLKENFTDLFPASSNHPPSSAASQLEADPRPPRTDFHFIDEINLGTFSLDLGTIIAGNKGVGAITVRCLSRTGAMFSLDLRNYKALGLSITNSRSIRLTDSGPSNQAVLSVTFKTVKTMKSGKVTFNVPLRLENGSQYTLLITANVNVPELLLSATEADFGHIDVGLGRKVWLALTNPRDVVCDWNAHLAPPTKEPKKKEEIPPPCFAIFPDRGSVPPGGKRYVEITFEPTECRSYNEMFVFLYKDSNKRSELIVKGEGVIPQITFQPKELTFEPCLPRSKLLRPIEIRNPSQSPVELIASELDRIASADARIVRELDSHVWRAPLRALGAPLPQDLIARAAALTKNRQIDAEVARINEKISGVHAQISEATGTGSEELHSTLEDLSRQLAAIEMNRVPLPAKRKPPLKVPEHLKVHAWLVSASDELELSVAEALAEEMALPMIQISALLEWNIERETHAGKFVQEFISTKRAEFAHLRDEFIKKNKAKKNAVFELQEDEFVRPSAEMFVDLLKTRLGEEDCRQGAIFSGLAPGFVEPSVVASALVAQLPPGTLKTFIFSEHDAPMNPSEPPLDSSNHSEPLLNPSAPVDPSPDLLGDFERARSRIASRKATEEQRTVMFRKLETPREFPFSDSQRSAEISLLTALEEQTPIKLIYPNNVALAAFQVAEKLPGVFSPQVEDFPLPEPETYSLYSRSIPAPHSRTLTNFKLYTFKDENGHSMSSDSLLDPSDPESIERLLDPSRTRWVVPPRGSLFLAVAFSQETIGEFSETLVFECAHSLLTRQHKGWTMALKAKTALPEISRNPVNVFPVRRRNRAGGPIKNSYILSENVFDFGSLLVQHSLDAPSRFLNRHRAQFRLTNTSPFAGRLQLVLASRLTDAALVCGQPATAGVFKLEAEEYTIPPGETLEVPVWALPQEPGNFADTLLVCVEDNPQPYSVSLRCDAAKPVLQLSASSMPFDRQLIGRAASRILELKNASAVPLAWRAVNKEALATLGFGVEPSEGVLEPWEAKQVSVSFSSATQEKRSVGLVFESRDVEDRKLVAESTVELKGEAFEVALSVSGFSDERGSILDFGETQVGVGVSRSLTVRNAGLYPVSYEFVLSSKKASESFKVSPKSGSIPPGASSSITFDFLSTEEVDFESGGRAAEVLLRVFEDGLNETTKEVKFFLRGRAQFSKLAFSPSQTLNLGPVLFSETRTASFEILNEGLFEFSFELFEAGDNARQAEARKRLEPLEAARGARGPKPPARKVESLTINQFTLSPNGGSVPAGGRVKVDVTFKGKGAQFFEAKVGVELTNRGQSEVPRVLLSAESCVPSIETRNYRVIFEEQAVADSLPPGPTAGPSCVFAVEDNTFYFGSAVPAKFPSGLTERLKIINNGKVPAVVRAELAKKGSAPSAFSILGLKTQTLEPHSFGLLKLNFKPEVMAQYEAVLSVVVENAPPNSPGSKLLVDLRGDGSLPSLRVSGGQTIEFGRIRLGATRPAALNVKNAGSIPATAIVQLEGPSVFRLKISEKTLAPGEGFVFDLEFVPDRPQMFDAVVVVSTLMNPFERAVVALKGEGFTETLSFEGLGPEDLLDFGETVLDPADSRGPRRALVLKNNSANTLRFEFPQIKDDRLTVKPGVGHIAPGASKKVNLVLNAGPAINYVRTLGIQTNEIILRAPSGMKLRRWDDSKVQKITVSKEEAQWRETTRALREKFELERATNPRAREPALPPRPVPASDAPLSEEINEPLPEPLYEVIADSHKEVPLRVLGKLDLPGFVIEPAEVVFKRTLMYSSRSFPVRVKNLAIVRAEYTWDFLDESGFSDPGAFSVTPESGLLEGGSSRDFQLRFCPIEGASLRRRLVFRVRGTGFEKELWVSGDAERPVCHFELPAQNSGGARAVDIEAVGWRSKAQKRFYVVNTTALGFEFEWLEGGVSSPEPRIAPSELRCLTPRGAILPGKKFEMVFEFTPAKDSPARVERSFTFRVPAQELEESFVLRGLVSEPQVTLSATKSDFGPLLVGARATDTVTLRNLDGVARAFSVSRASVRGAQVGFHGSLNVSPLSGILPPGGEAPLTIAFSPRAELEYNFNLVVTLEDRKDPLFINVKGSGYRLYPEISLSGRPLAPGARAALDFGELFIDEQRSETLIIANAGAFNFDFALRVRDAPPRPRGKKPVESPQTSTTLPLELGMEGGTVRSGESATVEIRCQPGVAGRFVGRLVLGIASGPTFELEVRGSAKTPQLEVAPKAIDFGLVPAAGLGSRKTAELRFVNKDTRALPLELADALPEELEVRLLKGQAVMPSLGSKENCLRVPITLALRGAGRFERRLEFLVNGTHRLGVNVRAEGVPVSVELADPSHYALDMGAVVVGSAVERSVGVVNRSRLPVSLDLDAAGQLSALRALGFLVSPASLTLPAMGRAELHVRYEPRERAQGSSASLFYGLIETGERAELLKLGGSALGMDVKLLDSNVAFGPVVVGASAARKIQLMNQGDMALDFRWDLGFMAPYFAVEPTQGTAPSGASVYFDVLLRPLAQGDIRAQAKLLVEGLSSPFLLNLTGKGIPTPAESCASLTFEASARDTVTQQVTVRNTGNSNWVVKPSLLHAQPDMPFFSVKPATEIQANSSAKIDVTFRPMRSQPPITKATLFVPLFDGTGLQFELVGRVLPAKPLDTFTLAIPAKSFQTLTLPPANWLSSAQRLKLSFEMAESGDDPLNSGIQIDAPQFVDLPPLATQKIQVCFYALLKGNFSLKCSFTNPDTKEYFFFLIDLKVENVGLIKSFQVETFVREPKTLLIPIENPLRKAARILRSEITFDCPCLGSPLKEEISVKAQGEVALDLLFFPLIEYKQATFPLKISSADLGEFLFEVVLTSKKNVNIPSINFKTSLGTDASKKFTFQNFLKKPTTFVVKIERMEQTSPDIASSSQLEFFVESPNVQAQPATDDLGTTNTINVRFEPSAIATSKALLTVSHPEAGEFKAYLIGIATQPLPKGPFKVTPKGYTIEFKNPFNEATEFEIKSDASCFALNTKPTTRIEAKKQLNVQITFKPTNDGITNGRLFIETKEGIAWIFFLQGVLNDK